MTLNFTLRTPLYYIPLNIIKEESKMVSKKEFIEKLATKQGITKSEAQNQTDAFIDTLADVCINGGGISFKGMFTFKKVLKKGRSGKVNGVEYSTPDSTSIKVTIGSALKEMLNK